MKKFLHTLHLFITTSLLIIVLYNCKIRDDNINSINQIKNNDLIFIKKICKEVKLENVLDSISYANQLGRLDLVSLILAIFAILLGFGAIYSFLHIKEESKRTAKETAEKVATEYFEAEAKINSAKKTVNTPKTIAKKNRKDNIKSKGDE